MTEEGGITVRVAPHPPPPHVAVGAEVGIGTVIVVTLEGIETGSALHLFEEEEVAETEDVIVLALPSKRVDLQ